MEKRIINISVTDTWTDEEIIENLSRQIYNFGHIKGNICTAIVTLIFERDGETKNEPQQINNETLLEKRSDLLIDFLSKYEKFAYNRELGDIDMEFIAGYIKGN